MKTQSVLLCLFYYIYKSQKFKKTLMQQCKYLYNQVRPKYNMHLTLSYRNLHNFPQNKI